MRRCYSCFKEYDSGFSVCPHCGQIADDAPLEAIHLLPGTVLAQRYIVGQAVGAGGFGIVYKAYDLKLEIIVAIKEFFVSRLVTRAEGLKNLIISKKSQAEYEYRKERFLAEARNMAKFGTHRNIPNVFEFFEENNTAYIVMELLHGVALNEYIAQNKEIMDPDFALMIANEVGNALVSLHEQGIIHRDVAPDNIFICTENELKIKLMDLGAAKLADTTDDVIDIILKPGYSPAEQYDNSKNIGPWTDIYALGATLYYMLTGIKPDESTNRKIQDEVLPPNQINPNISENLSNAIMKAMAVERHMRFKNVQEFLAAINGERKVVTLVKERKQRRRRRAFGIVAACLVLCVGLYFGFNTYADKKADQYLNPASIEVWFSVADGSTEEVAMNSVKADFEEAFPDVQLNLVAIPEAQYGKKLKDAANSGQLPALFESSGLSNDILSKALDLDPVIASDQFKSALFLDMYSDYYSTKKQMPLAIEVPVAYLITNGATSVHYSDSYFSDLKDFGTGITFAMDDRYKELVEQNFTVNKWGAMSEFMNNAGNIIPVMLSSTMAFNEVRTTLTNYEKAYVYPNLDKIYCNFIYEWSIGTGSEDELAAAERLLSWMLGNVYQSTLMISECQEGQIPVNPICFESKIQAKNLVPIRDIYQKFTFSKER